MLKVLIELKGSTKIQRTQIYGWLQKKRELSESVLSDFIKFL
jgi:hypothetical protein